MNEQLQEVILDLIYLYSPHCDKPTIYELTVVENALPFVKEIMETNTYDSWIDWIKRHKPNLEV